MATELERVKEIVRHKQHVLDACILLGERLMERGEEAKDRDLLDLGRQLIANGFEHDVGKFFGAEYWILSDADADREKLKMIVEHHAAVNKHHPEYWGPKGIGIKRMPREFLAEMFADWSARAAEFRTDLWDWICSDAMSRFGFNKRDKVYRDIKFFFDILVNKEFTPLPSQDAK